MVYPNVPIVVPALDEIMNKIKPHVLFISYDGMTDPLGQSQVIPYLQGLTANGYAITLLSCEKPEVYETGKQHIQTLLTESNIEWHPIMYTKRPPVLSTLYDIYNLKRTAKKIYRAHKFVMVHTRPGIPALVGLWLKKKFGVAFLNDIREFYADSRVDGGMWNPSSFLYRTIYNYFKTQEFTQVKESDGIVCLTHAAEKVINEWPVYNKQTPLEVIPCSVDLALFDPARIDQELKNKYAQQLNIHENDFVISYLGSIGGWYLTEEMLRFCKLLSDQISEARFLFISPHRHEQILAAASRYNIPAEKIITVKASRKEVPVLASFSNYSLFFIKPCFSKLSSSPTKHGELMALGIPVITNGGVGDMYEIVTSNKAGFITDDFTDASFNNIIATLKNKPSFSKNDIRHAAHKIYALDNAVRAYTRLYNKILGN
ncbi:MAG: glycosyltransferase [Sphingobacteriales bacterium]|nr:MAG: glycosyltransferase [Sphingobacteriales bacterium]